jgi:hypothetical protein
MILSKNCMDMLENDKTNRNEIIKTIVFFPKIRLLLLLENKPIK